MLKILLNRSSTMLNQVRFKPPPFLQSKYLYIHEFIRETRMSQYLAFETLTIPDYDYLSSFRLQVVGPQPNEDAV